MTRAKRCQSCPRRNDFCVWPVVGCVDVGEVFRYRQREYRRVGPMILAREHTDLLRWRVRRLPDALTDEIVGGHQNSIIVQREHDGCICFMECSLELDDVIVRDPCDGCALLEKVRGEV